MFSTFISTQHEGQSMHSKHCLTLQKAQLCQKSLTSLSWTEQSRDCSCRLTSFQQHGNCKKYTGALYVCFLLGYRQKNFSSWEVQEEHQTPDDAQTLITSSNLLYYTLMNARNYDLLSNQIIKAAFVLWQDTCTRDPETQRPIIDFFSLFMYDSM